MKKIIIIIVLILVSMMFLISPVFAGEAKGNPHRPTATPVESTPTCWFENNQYFCSD